MSFGQMSVFQMSFGQMPIGGMSVGQMAWDLHRTGKVKRRKIVKMFQFFFKILQK